VTFGASTAASAASSGVTGGGNYSFYSNENVKQNFNFVNVCCLFRSDDDAFAPEHFPYFTHHVKDLFYKFVDNAAANTKEK